ncbi:MAG: hypothetical protein ABI891_14895, partial [Acidobacteriota bacterium]
MFELYEKKSDFYLLVLERISTIVFMIFAVIVSASAQTPQATPPPNQPTTPPTQQQTEIQRQNNNQTQQNNQPNQPTNPAQPQAQPQVTTPANPNTPGVTPSGQIANPNTVIQQTPTQNVGTSGIAPAVLPDDPPPIAPNF